MAVDESTTAPTASSNGAESASTVDTLPEPVVPEGAKTLAVEPAGVATLSYEYPRYPIAPGYRVYVRTGPGTNYAPLRLLPLGAMVAVYCQKAGERVSGPYGSSNLWDCISADEYVSDAYVHTGSDGWIATRCS
ncbi:SH3 domain-containing protein [Streptomyces sp. NBC_00247]|uniref:SH3 domain-containing protein n=1 Tax=Streptomyces sp. NBC_00247 TaxID=2975689 RepID=UPI002E2D00EB|nr:SH3 domain-containing protein [Streptomyces sp. NBC_00247]